VTNIDRKSVKLFTEQTFGVGVTRALSMPTESLPVLNVLFTKLAITQHNVSMFACSNLRLSDQAP